MADDLEDVRRKVASVLHALDDATDQSFAVWRDDVAHSFEHEFLLPLREAALQFEKALRAAAQVEDEVDSLPTV